MAANEILVERRNQSLIITFNRPDHANSMTIDMANQLFNILKATTTDKSTRAVMLRGAGSNYMDGLDMSYYSKDVSSALDTANQLILPYHSAIRELQTMDKPVLSVIRGHVTGAGFSLMLASDLVIASDKSMFNTSFAKHALSPDGGCSFFLPRKVGMSRAIEILMLCEEFNAERAERLRIVNKVVPDVDLEDEALKWLDKLTSGPTKAYGAIKKLACQAFEQDLNKHLGLEHNYFGQTSRSFDFREAVRAHAAGRESKFTGT